MKNRITLTAIAFLFCLHAPANQPILLIDFMNESGAANPASPDANGNYWNSVGSSSSIFHNNTDLRLTDGTRGLRHPRAGHIDVGWHFAREHSALPGSFASVDPMRKIRKNRFRVRKRFLPFQRTQLAPKNRPCIFAYFLNSMFHLNIDVVGDALLAWESL